MNAPGRGRPIAPRGARLDYARARAVYCLAATAAVILLWLFEDALLELPLRTLCAAAAAGVAAAAATLILLTRRGGWSLSSIYAVVFLVFHFGLVSVYGTGLPIDDERAARSAFRWFHSTTTKRAVVLSAAGFLVFSVTALAAGGLASRRGRAGPRPRGPARAPDLTREPFGDASAGESRDRDAFELTGFLITVGSVALWSLLVYLSGGLSLLTGGYLEFLEATKDVPLGVIYNLLGVGVICLVVGRRGHLRAAGLLAFAAWAVVVFPLGLRGEVLFIVATALGVAAMTRPPFPARNLLIAALPCLVAISFVREYRKTGFSGASVSLNSVNPLSALTELGSSLRPVVEVVDWADDGDPFIYGASIVAPFDRTLTRLVPVGERVAGEDDERIMSVLVKRRVGTIGFSPVAEGYRNGGMLGVLLLLGATGFVVGAIDFGHATPLRQALAGVLFLALLVEVRNDFFFVPIYVMLGWAIVLGVHWVDQAVAGRDWPGGSVGRR